MKFHVLGCLVFTAMFACAEAIVADEAEVSARLAKIPPAAATALKRSARTATIRQVNIEKDGKITVYEAELVEVGKPDREVSVTADGIINAEEESVTMEKVPEAVRKSIDSHAKGANVKRVQRIVRSNGGTTFEALYISKGKQTEVEFLESGELKPEGK